MADPEGHLVLNSDFPNMCLAFDSTGGVIDGRPMILGNCANVDSEMFRIDK